MKTNSKRFWSYAKSQKMVKSLPVTMKYNDIELSSLPSIVSNFNIFFKSMFSTASFVLPSLNVHDVRLFILIKLVRSK